MKEGTISSAPAAMTALLHYTKRSQERQAVPELRVAECCPALPAWRRSVMRTFKKETSFIAYLDLSVFTFTTS